MLLPVLISYNSSPTNSNIKQLEYPPPPAMYIHLSLLPLQTSPRHSIFLNMSYNGGNRNSLQLLEKKATATPNTATLRTTLAFSGDVRVVYVLAK